MILLDPEEREVESIVVQNKGCFLRELRLELKYVGDHWILLVYTGAFDEAPLRISLNKDDVEFMKEVKNRTHNLAVNTLIKLLSNDHREEALDADQTERLSKIFKLYADYDQGNITRSELDTGLRNMEISAV